MAKSVEQLLQEQIGGLTFQLCIQENKLQVLQEENAKLKEQMTQQGLQDKK